MEMLLVEKYRKEAETLRTQLAKANERVAELEKENKRESMELRSRLGSALGRNSEYNSAIENMQQKLAKANERVGELSLIIDKVCSYVQTDDEGNEPFIEVDNALAALIFDDQERSNLLNKFAIEKKIEGAYAVISLLDETKDSKTILMANKYVREQLRKEQEK